MEVTVSVIVPVYNAEKHLPQCVESLLRQTQKGIELIFVDDGSNDHSVEMLEKYREQNGCIQILRQKNQYAGVARNNGLKEAQGKYVIFLDADDFFDRHMLEDAYRCAEKNQADMVIFGCYIFDDSTGISKKGFSPLAHNTFSASELQGRELYGYYLPAPWNKLIRRELILQHHIQFDAVKKCNDVLFTYLTYVLAERIVPLQKRLVYYRVGNTQSLQGNVRRDRESFIRCGIATIAELRRRGLYSGNIKDCFRHHCKVLVKMGMESIADTREGEAYYRFAKSHLIPDLFDFPAEFSDDPLLRNLYDSDDYTEFLLLCNQSLTCEIACTVPKSSKDYRLGHALLAIPRKIWHAIN